MVNDYFCFDKSDDSFLRLLKAFFAHAIKYCELSSRYSELHFSMSKFVSVFVSVFV